jgi:hypothetical protein
MNARSETVYRLLVSSSPWIADIRRIHGQVVSRATRSPSPKVGVVWLTPQASPQTDVRRADNDEAVGSESSTAVRSWNAELAREHAATTAKAYRLLHQFW